VQQKKATRSHFWDLTEYAIIVKLKDIEQTNVPKNRIGTTEDRTTTTTTTETFLVEEEAMAMAARRIINLKETATIAASRGMPKQRAG
jgi:hypothetical protein